MVAFAPSHTPSNEGVQNAIIHHTSSFFGNGKKVIVKQTMPIVGLKPRESQDRSSDYPQTKNISTSDKGSSKNEAFDKRIVNNLDECPARQSFT